MKPEGNNWHFIKNYILFVMQKIKQHMLICYKFHLQVFNANAMAGITDPQSSTHSSYYCKMDKKKHHFMVKREETNKNTHIFRTARFGGKQSSS